MRELERDVPRANECNARREHVEFEELGAGSDEVLAGNAEWPWTGSSRDRASPYSVSTPAFLSAASRFGGTGSVKVRLKRMSAGQSMAAWPATPCSRIPSCQATRSAAPTSTFLGSHPRTAQVPP